MPKLTPDQVQTIVMAKAGKGVTSASYFYRGRLTELISVLAPTRKVYRAQYELRTSGGITRYVRGKDLIIKVATTRATPGAPPRRVTGRLRASITVRIEKTDTETTGIIGTNVIYAKRLEFGGHPYFRPTMEAQKTNLTTIVAGAA
jgi:hypothetical protein